MAIEIDKQQMQAWFNTAREGGMSLEDGDVEPGWSALNTLADSIWFAAYRSGVTLDIPAILDDEDEEED